MKIDAIKLPADIESSQDADGFPIESTEWSDQIPCTLESVTRAGMTLALKSGYQAQWECRINAANYDGQTRVILVSEDKEYGVARTYLDGADIVLTLSFNEDSGREM